MKVESLNLHGLSLEEALQKSQQNLEWCIKHGVDVLDLNHGKGHHSKRNFSVLKQEIRKMLKDNKYIKESGYKIIYGESDIPIALEFDEGHTLIVIRGKESEYIGGKKQQDKKQEIFSNTGRQQRKVQKNLKAQKRKGGRR
jgi:hypothetical protein